MDETFGDWKCRVRGETVDGEAMETVVKIGPTGKVVIITVYRI
jgi:hypothetical protein